jgi:phenylacetate-CoA ligase
VIACPAPDARYHDAAELADPASLVSDRWELISEMLALAQAALPFYRRRFADHGHVPDRVCDPAEFAERVPVTRKQDLVDATRAGGVAEVGIEALDGAPTSNLVMTSGTGGFPTFAALTRADLAGPNLLGQARELWMIGVRPGMRVVTMSPAWHVLALLESEALTHLGAVPIVPWGTYLGRFAPDVLEAIGQHRAEHLLATVPVFDALLDECERRSQDPREVFASVRLAACAGQAITPAYRARLIDAFGLDDLFERGGSSDGMFGGAECEAHRGHHVFADLHYVEIVDPETGALLPPGRRGVAVVTNLTRGRSVYIRFETGDVAEIVPGDCPCGRTHPVVEFYGRLDECVRLGPRFVAPVDVRRTLDTWPQFDRCALTLEPSEDARGVRVVVHRDDLPETLVDAARRRLTEELGIVVELSTTATPAGSQGWKGQAMRSERA